MVSVDQLDKLTLQNNVGNTILHEASTSDKLVQAAKEMLIKAPELLNICNNFDVTPLYRSVEFGRMDMFKFLDDLIRRQKQTTDQEGDLEADPEVYYHRKNKTTVLHTAVVIGSFDLALFIATRYKHLVDEQDNDGMTSLQLLACNSLAFESRGGGGFLKRLLCSRVLTEDMSTAAGEDSSYRLRKEMIYLDKVEEFKSTMRKDGNGQDQRLILFKSPVHFETDRVEDVFDESSVEKCEEWINDKAASRSSRKSRKASEKRQRMRSISKEGINVKDVEYLIYYRGSFDNSQNENLRSDHRQKHHKRTPPNETRKSLGAQARVGQPRHRVNNGED
ncbi:hypothetical protein RHGRI_017751 [Rhododendron griersonianum]|uniref:Uncharacterized protein n=1 Tax=Rhododendron griersonianum TaxID=479676 RepID=A0AAV6JYX7_9ERIC|nr:hypothetical protein RHGRI_017751 [Rhododendron griersonianum]